MRHRVRRQHVGAHARQHEHDVGKQLQAIERLDIDLHLKRRVLRQVAFPMHLHDALGLGHELLGVRAVAAVHRHAAAARDEADDVVARHGVAAARQAHERAFHALHHHAV